MKPKECEICNKDFSVNTKGYTIRRRIGNTLVCLKCARNHIKQKTFHEKYTLGIDYKEQCDICKENIITMKKNDKFVCKHCSKIKIKKIRQKVTYEERKKLNADISKYKKERSEYLRSIPPEKFIAIVMGEDDEM